MKHEDFVFWSAVVMLANIPPQLIFGYLFIQWHTLARRQWVKYCFLIASVLSFAFVILRMTGFLLNDDLYLRMISMWVFLGGSYYTAIMFTLSTKVVKRRVRADEMVRVENVVKTSDLLCAVSCELKEIVGKHTIKTNAHSHIV